MTYPPYGNRPQGGRPYQPYVRPQQQPQQGSPRQQWQPQEQPYGPYGAYGGGYVPQLTTAADLPLAPIWRRAGARLLDSVIVWAFGFAVVYPVTVGAIGLDNGAAKSGTNGTPWTTPLLVTFFIVACVLPFLYEAALLTAWGQTLGKRLLGLRVVAVDPAGEPIQLPRAIWRALINNVGYQLPAFFFLLLAINVWVDFLFGLFLTWIGVLLSYLWAIWDHPLHQSVHDRFAGTVVVDDREYDEDEEEE